MQKLKEEVKKLEINFKLLESAENKVKNFILEQQSNKIVKEVLM